MRSLPTGTSTWPVLVLGGFIGFCSLIVPKASAEPLQAHVEHTVRLPAVDPTLRPGATFNLNAARAPSNLWIRIPHWLAGKWGVDVETTVFHENYLTGQTSEPQQDFRARSRFSYGHQTDSHGEIWHYVGTPYTSSTVADMYTEYHKVASKTLNRIGARAASLKTRVTVVRANTSTLTVVKTYQQESITRYTYISSVKLLLQSSTKVFDAAGVATDEGQNEANVDRLAPYTPTNSDATHDYHELFREFLTAQGLTDLLPEEK